MFGYFGFFYYLTNTETQDSAITRKTITIKTEKGSITRQAVIIADRHIHITKEDREKYNLLKDEYEIKVENEKGGILSHIHIKEAPNSYFELHLDSDDANAFNIKQDDEVEIL